MDAWIWIVLLSIAVIANAAGLILIIREQLIMKLQSKRIEEELREEARRLFAEQLARVFSLHRDGVTGIAITHKRRKVKTK